MMGQNPRMSYWLKNKKKLLMQNMQIWRYFMMGHSTEDDTLQCHAEDPVGTLSTWTWYFVMHIPLQFIPKAAKLFIREQGLDKPERLGVLTKNNINNICNVVKKPGKECQWNTRQRATGISHSSRKPEASCLPIPLQVIHIRLESYKSVWKHSASDSRTEEAWRWVQRSQHAA